MTFPNFKNKTLLQQALTHSSYAREYGTDDNERLEFLGDSIIEFVVRTLLFTQYPMLDEGDLSKRSFRIVDQTQLAAMAVMIGLPNRLRLGSGAQHERHNPSVQSDAFEALMGAYYLDAGVVAAYDYIQSLFRPLVDQAMTLDPTDPVTALQEYVQAHFGGQLPDYRQLSVSGPDHAKTFEMAVFINHKCWGIGRGSRKKEARKYAAVEALNSLKSNPNPPLEEWRRS